MVNDFHWTVHRVVRLERKQPEHGSDGCNAGLNLGA